MKKDTLEYRMMQERQRLKIPDSKLLTGSLTGKYPVILDDGKTIIFISDKSKESEIRKTYELRMGNRIMFSSNKPKS
jgi:WD40-like Beta Propeller Repeat